MKCDKCGKESYPWKNPDGSTNWRNIMHVDWNLLFITVSVLFMAWAYIHDIKGTQQDLNKCMSILNEQNSKGQLGINSVPDWQDKLGSLPSFKNASTESITPAFS